MISIIVNDEHRNLVKSRAPSLDIGGYSNLKSKDLSKASRLEYQFTGLYGEAVWYSYRGKFNKFADVLDYKLEVCKKNGIGDSGFDDSITYNGVKKLVDIKTSHIENEVKISNLNLIIPPRELHKNMIYVCAFTVGKDRVNVDKVVLAGWCLTEDVKKKWQYDNTKFCVPVRDLRDMKDLVV